MMRSGQRTGPFGLPLWSASQAKKASLAVGACPRRWAYERLLGLKEEFSVKANAGSELHAEMEAWTKLGVLPSSKPACQALRYSPAPGVAEAEVPVRFQIGSTHWVGYIDLAYDWDTRTNKPAPVGTTGRTVIHDWKFSSVLRGEEIDHPYFVERASCPQDLRVPGGLKADELMVDYAACIYAAEAYSGGAHTVECRWVYVSFDASVHYEVRVTMNPVTVKSVLLELHETAASYNTARANYRAGAVTIDDFARDTRRCFDYRRPCQAIELCSPPEDESGHFTPKARLEYV